MATQRSHGRRSAARGAALEVALAIPLQGPAGIFGPSCELCAQLAVEEINARGGVLGREVHLVVVDAGAAPQDVADVIDLLIRADLVDAVVGWHISAVRQAVAPRIAQRVPYVYTPLYEGGERTPGVFLTGETPARQILPAMRWMAQEAGVRRWCTVGDDYVWPRASAAAARRFATACGAQIRDEVFVELGTGDFSAALRRIAESDCDGVLMLLVGEDAVHFNRQFAAAGLDASCVRLSPLMEENMLLASGAEHTRGVYASAGYFEALPTPENLDFSGRFISRFGVDAPVLNSLGESCYEGVSLLAALIDRAGSADTAALCTVADSARYEGPRGDLRLRQCHLDQTIYLAQAVGLEFDIVGAL